MSKQRIMEILQETGALLDGHFLLSSGRHSNRYIQCARVLRYPRYAAKVIGELIKQVEDEQIDLVVGPAMGGVIVSYELGRQLQKETIFAERKDGEFKIRRGFEIKPGDRVLIAEDVVTTGKSTLETKGLIESLGGKVVGVACIVDRTGDSSPLDFPIYSTIELEIKTFDQSDCPLCSQGIPVMKPGSREL